MFLFMSMHQEKAPFTIRKKTLIRTRHASTLISHFQPPEPWENKCLFFKSSSLWYFCFAFPMFSMHYKGSQTWLCGRITRKACLRVCVCVCVVY